MAEKNRSSALALVKETVPGTIEAPTLGTQFVALQEGFTFSPGFETLENAEIRSSIGRSKPIQGLEQPSGSFEHYFRASGVEGQAPSYGVLIESVLGSVSSNATERLTAAASTVSLLKLAAGGGDFARGSAVLVKDGTNGYSVRPVDSVATNDLTLGFDLPGAPAAGLGVGKDVKYSPQNDSHPKLSAWLYRGNGGVLEVLAGSQVTEMSISVAAGELINASFSLEGTKYFFNPIRIQAADQFLDFTDADGTFAAQVSVDYYRDPHELAAAIQAAMRTANPLKAHTVVYVDTSGKFLITRDGATLSLLWNTGANTANTIGDKIGFSTAADDTGAASYLSDNAQSWAPSLTPSYDAADPQAAKNNEILLGDADNIVCFCASSIDISIVNNTENVLCACEESGLKEKIISSREVEANIVAILDRHDADKFKKFRSNEDVKFLFNFGSKSGGNWVAGTVGSVYLPSSSISSFELGDENGIVTMNITVRAYVNTQGQGECYINFL